MLLPLGATAIVAAVLLWELSLPRLRNLGHTLARQLASRRARARERAQAGPAGFDPGRELRAEQRARALLRSCVNDEEWSMYRDLGFLRVWGGEAARADGDRPRGAHGSPTYAYLIYPHRPIVAYLPATGTLLNEYCVAFPDHSRPYGSTRLPDADDVLAKWMALTADERRLIADANMHLPGRQLDPEQVRHDLGRLARWERERVKHRRPEPRARRVGQPLVQRGGEPLEPLVQQGGEPLAQRESERIRRMGRGAGSVPAQ
jgi:hypothetical protein